MEEVEREQRARRQRNNRGIKKRGVNQEVRGYPTGVYFTDRSDSDWKKDKGTDRSESEMVTGWRREQPNATANPCVRKDKKVYFTDLDEEVMVDFAKDHEELYDKTPQHVQEQCQERWPLGKICKKT